jgi:hypothetical protein
MHVMPTTSEGKAITRFNAVKSGTRSATVPLPHELTEFEIFEARTLDALAPRDAIEEELAHRAIALFWRLRRFAAWESFRLSTPATMLDVPGGALAMRLNWLNLFVRAGSYEGATQERADRLERSLQKQLLEVLASIKAWRAP